MLSSPLAVVALVVVLVLVALVVVYRAELLLELVVARSWLKRLACRVLERHTRGGAFVASGRFLDRKGFRRVELLACRHCGQPAIPSATPGPIEGARRTTRGRR